MLGFHHVDSRELVQYSIVANFILAIQPITVYMYIIMYVGISAHAY